MAKKNFYAVVVGRTPGIYDSWDHADPSKSAKAQVDKYPGAKYKGYATYEEAYAAVYGAVPKKEEPVVQDKHLLKYEPTNLSISTDAACSGNPGVLEYRIVWTDTGEVIHHSPKFRYGTNNIGEFLALVWAIRYARKHRLDCDIYTDSVSAIAWVRNKKIKSSFDLNKCPELRNEVIEALEYLEAHEPYERVLKWNTQMQGEIKADFGRK